MPNWCHNTLTVSGESDELMKFVEAAKPKEENYRQQYDEMWVPEGEEKPSWEKWWSLISDNQPLSFESLFPQPPEEELKKLETLVPCTMCGAHGELPESPEQAEERGAKWYEWMDPETREDRTCNSCQGTKKERQLGTYEGWYSWRLENWGTKWNAYELAVKRAQAGLLEITFQTAWSFPEPVFAAIAREFPGLQIECVFFDEGWNFAGTAKLANGRCDIAATKELANAEMYERVYGQKPEIDEEGAE